MAQFNIFNGVNTLLLGNPPIPNSALPVSDFYLGGISGGTFGINDPFEGKPQEIYTYRILGAFEVIDPSGKKNVSYQWIPGWIDDDTFSEKLTAKWEALKDSLGGLISDVNRTLSVFGASLITKFMHQLIWTDADNPTFEINMKLIAEQNAFTEVYAPGRYLQMLQAPSERKLKNINPTDPTFGNYLSALSAFLTDSNHPGETSMLVPPGGPAINVGIDFQDGATLVKFIALKVGKLFTLRNLIVDDVEVNWDIRNVDTKGFPLSAVAKISFIGTTLWTTQTLGKLLGQSSTTSTSDSRNDGDALTPDILIDLIKQFPQKAKQLVSVLGSI